MGLSLYRHLGGAVLLQLEAFLARLLLPLAAGKGAPGGVGCQEAALEVGFCRYQSRGCGVAVPMANPKACS